MKNKSRFILISSVLAIVILSFTDYVLKFPYIIRTPFKLIMFIGIVLFYAKLSGENIIKSSVENQRGGKLGFKITLSAFVFVVIALAYYFLSGFIDVASIKADVSEKYKIGKTTFIFVALYISFVNSFLEELFFRGFLFLNLKSLSRKKLGYIFSSALFAIYHIPNIYGWFSPVVMGLATLGLFVGGLIFSYLDDRNNSFINSYIVHISADLAIVIIGYFLLYF